MTCLLFKSQSGSLQSSGCLRLSKRQIPERILNVNIPRVRTGRICCYSQSSRGNKPGRKPERNVNVQGGGFASLAALLQQQRVVEEKKSKASKKVTKMGTITTGKSSLEQPREKDNKAARRENSHSPSPESNLKTVSEGKLTVAGTGLDEAPKQNVGPLTEEEQTFSEAVLAALKDSALERQRKLRKRNNARKGKRPSEGTVTEGKRMQLDDVKPVFVKPEWRVAIEALEKKLNDLKQEYYNRV